MFNTNIPYSVPVTPYGTNGNGNGLFGGDSWAWIIVLLLLFGWGGNGGFGGFGGFGGGGYSEVQRGFDHNSVINKLDGLTYGLSDSTYALSNAIKDCCCTTQRGIDGVNFNMAKGFCDLVNVVNNSTRDILESNNANTRDILDFMSNSRLEDLRAENTALKAQIGISNQNAFITANQEAQTAELIRRLGADCPVPAYVVQPPAQVSFPVNSCGQFTGYGGCGCA